MRNRPSSRRISLRRAFDPAAPKSRRSPYRAPPAISTDWRWPIDASRDVDWRRPADARRVGYGLVDGLVLVEELALHAFDACQNGGTANLLGEQLQPMPGDIDRTRVFRDFNPLFRGERLSHARTASASPCAGLLPRGCRQKAVRLRRGWRASDRIRARRRSKFAKAASISAFLRRSVGPSAVVLLWTAERHRQGRGRPHGAPCRQRFSHGKIGRSFRFARRREAHRRASQRGQKANRWRCGRRRSAAAFLGGERLGKDRRICCAAFFRDRFDESDCRPIRLTSARPSRTWSRRRRFVVHT